MGREAAFNARRGVPDDEVEAFVAARDPVIEAAIRLPGSGPATLRIKAKAALLCASGSVEIMVGEQKYPIYRLTGQILCALLRRV
ncbi:MAG: hypothetical protein ABW003_20875 [Microvirga sp.]